MWIVRKIADDWGETFRVGEYIDDDYDGDPELFYLNGCFETELLAQAVCDRLNEGGSICEYCDRCVDGECEFQKTCPKYGYELFLRNYVLNALTGEKADIRTQIPTHKNGANKARLRTFSGVFDFWATAALMLIAGAVFSGLCWQKNMWLAICAYWCVLLIKNAVLFAAHDEMKEEKDAD